MVSQNSVLHNNTLPLTLANSRCYSTGFMKRQELKPCMVISRGGDNHSGVKFRSTALMMPSTSPKFQPEEVFWNPSSLSAFSLRFVLCCSFRLAHKISRTGDDAERSKTKSDGHCLYGTDKPRRAVSPSPATGLPGEVNARHVCYNEYTGAG